MSLMKDWLDTNQKIKKLQTKKVELEAKLYTKYQEQMEARLEGSIVVKDDLYKLTVVKKNTVKVDQALADVVKVGFRVKYELDKPEYKALPVDTKKRVDECLTTKPSKPSFKVTLVEDDK